MGSWEGRRRGQIEWNGIAAARQRAAVAAADESRDWRTATEAYRMRERSRNRLRGDAAGAGRSAQRQAGNHAKRHRESQEPPGEEEAQKSDDREQEDDGSTKTSRNWRRFRC